MVPAPSSNVLATTLDADATRTLSERHPMMPSRRNQAALRRATRALFTRSMADAPVRRGWAGGQVLPPSPLSAAGELASEASECVPGRRGRHLGVDLHRQGYAAMP